MKKSLHWPGVIFLLLGPLLYFSILYLVKLPGLSDDGLAVLAATAWIALWWITEVIPIPVTSLLPMILFPLSGAATLEATATPYANPLIYLYVGGFILAVAIERWNLHRRIALNIIYYVGTKPGRIILGFMVATAFLSMWISNTATSVMMLPMALAVTKQFNLGEKSAFGLILMLSIAYSASIGGIATLIGTPNNVVMAGVPNDLYQVELNFVSWMIFGVPVSAVLLFITWRYLISFLPRQKTMEISVIQEQLHALGKMRSGETRVSYIFILTALLWITSSFTIKPFFPQISDTIIAIFAVVLLFVVPSGESTQNSLLTWKQAERIPWGIVLLFGGGFSLASGFQETGLATYIGDQMQSFQALPVFVILLLIVLIVNFLTEVTSNVATASMILPILAALSLSMDLHPFLFLVGATMAASCAFMLPVATPPNAVVFGSGLIPMSEMVKKGFVLNLISVIWISVVVYLLLPLLWDFHPFAFPGSWLE